MTRLPQVGGDDGNWGAILNDFLLQAHAANGSLKPGSVGASQLQAGSIDETKLSEGAVTSLKGADGESVSVVLVEASAWPPAPDANPLHFYVKVPDGEA